MDNECLMSIELSEVLCTLVLDASLQRLGEPARSLHVEVGNVLVQGLNEVMEQLGIPGTPKVQITFQMADKLSLGRFLSIFVNGQHCHYPYEILQRAYCYANEMLLNPTIKPAAILAWLGELTAEEYGINRLNYERRVEFFKQSCLEIVKTQPAVLLSLQQVVSFINSLPTPTSNLQKQSEAVFPDPLWLFPVLKKVLNLKISLTDKQIVASILSRVKYQSQDDVAEELIAALCSDVIEIQLSPAYLRRISNTVSKDKPAMFTGMRKNLFKDLGLRYPEFRFVLVEGLKPNSFTFKINHLTVLPWTGLPPDQHLVDGLPFTLRSINIGGKAAWHPVSGNESSLIDSSFRFKATEFGYTVWNPMEYLTFCFVINLRENSPCFVHCQSIREQLDFLAQSFPGLVKAIQETFSIEQVTRVLRALSVEEVSICDLKYILEWMLNYDYIVTNPLNPLAFDEQLPVRMQPDDAWLNDPVDILSFIRIGMKRYLSYKYTHGNPTLNAVLIDSKIEQVLSDQNISTSEIDAVLEAVQAKIGTQQPNRPLQVLLTSIEVRLSLHEIIARTFPRLPVLAFQELLPDIIGQPIDAIMLTT